MNKRLVAQELIAVAKELVGKGQVPEAFKKQWKKNDKGDDKGDDKKDDKLPDFIKKKMDKKSGMVPGVPDGTGPYGRGERRLNEECPFDEDDAMSVEARNLRSKEDVLSFTVPLLIRIMEYSKEDAKTDMDLHVATENMLRLGADGTTLTMDDYDEIVGGASGD
jgi:hypothetical protein